MGRPSIDLTGKRVGRWQVNGRCVTSPSGSGKHAMWRCTCDCGTERTVNSAMLIQKKSTSCGCWQSEQVTARNTKHGQYGAKVYESWNGMLDRCKNKNHKYFKHYGGRGICVCDRWLTFENFLSDMGHPPTPLHSLDRSNVDGNYEPENCRWVTNDIQQNNKRNNVFIEFSSERLTIAQWSVKTGVADYTIRARLKRGWSIERAFTRVKP